MALKFLNKKGWHTGSLRNIENVWKAEQKHDAEQKKLEELRKQIHEERERSEFRQLQEQAGLVPRQERLEFLYDSGLAVGKTSEGSGFKALEATPKPSADAGESSSSAKPAAQAVPGALFEDKPHSANDAWRKLHSDPLLLIRQREQEALARVKNNPIQMAMIRKSVESKSNKEKDKDRDKKETKDKARDKKEHKEKSREKKECREKHHHSSSKHQKYSSSRQQSDSDNDTDDKIKRRKSSKHRSSDYDKHYHRRHSDSEDDLSERDGRSKKKHYKRLKVNEQSPNGLSDPRAGKDDGQDAIRKNHNKSKHDKYSSEDRTDPDAVGRERENKSFNETRSHDSSATALQHESRQKRRNLAPKLSSEERAARLREMQMDAEVHDEQRWKRLKKAEEDDAREASSSRISGGRNFLDAAHKSVYGAGKGGSSTIEESVRRRTHYLQGRSEANEGNAFRR